MTKTDIGIYRGLKEKFDPTIHIGFFITTDTGELLCGDQSLGQTISRWEINDGVLTLRFNTGNDLRVTFPEATETAKGLLSASDKAALNTLANDLNDKVDKVTGKSLIADSEIEKLAGLPNSTELTNSVANAKAAGDNAQSDLNAHKQNTSNPHSVTKEQVGLGNVTNDAQVKRSEMGVANGVATLDSTGKVPSSQLPSFVDDIVDVYATYQKSSTGVLSNIVLYSDAAKTKVVTGEAGKIYQNITTGEPAYQFRWTGTVFAQTGASSLILGVVEGTAYDGAKGKANADEIAKLKTQVSGLPDQEDITLNADNHLQLKDRDATNNGMGYKILRLPEDGVLTQDMINQANTIYEIRYDFDLNGATITIPENCTLKFNGGKFDNGTINLINGYLEGVQKRSLAVKVLGTISSLYCAYNFDNKELNSYVLAAARNGILLMEDIELESLDLYTSICGNGHKLQFDNSKEVGIYIRQSNITIDNVHIIKPVLSSEDINKKRAICSFVASNVSIKNSIIEGAIWFSAEEETLNCISLINSTIKCDFSLLNQSQENQNDVVTLKCVRNVTIENNIIVATNVTRIFKITGIEYSEGLDYQRESSSVNIRNNKITSECGNGKQVFDLYTGSINVYILNNVIKAKGHTRVFENKSFTEQLSHDEGLLNISFNTVSSDSGLILVNLSPELHKVLFTNNVCEANTANHPIEIHNCNSIVIRDNILRGNADYTGVEPYILFREDWSNNNSRVREAVVSRNSFYRVSYRPIYARKTEIDYIEVINNNLENMTALHCQNTATINRATVAVISKIEDYYCITNNGIIENLQLNLLYPVRRVILNQGTVTNIICNYPLSEDLKSIVASWKIIR